MIRGHFRPCRRLKSLSRQSTSLTDPWWNPIRIAFLTKSHCRTRMKTPTRRSGSDLLSVARHSRYLVQMDSAR